MTVWALGRKWNSIRSPGCATTFSGSKCRPLLAVVDPAVMRWTTPVGGTETAGMALVRLRRVVAMVATVRDEKESMVALVVGIVV